MNAEVDADRPAETSRRHRMPRWVRGFIAAAVVSLVIVAMVTIAAGGDHGPGRHEPGAPAGTTSHGLPVDDG